MISAYKYQGKDFGTNYLARFIVLSEKLSAMAAREDLEIVPFHNPELIYFSALKSDEQRLVIEQLETMVLICEQVQMQGAKIRSAKKLTWAFLKHFRCTAPSNLIDCMNDDDLVNAWGREHHLLFASLNFFGLLSYTLEELYCRSWMDLVRRPATEQEQLFNLANDLLDGRHQKVKPMTYIKGHEVEETTSKDRVAFWLEPQICSPLYNKGDIIGYVGAFRFEVLRSKKGIPPLSLENQFIQFPLKYL